MQQSTFAISNRWFQSVFRLLSCIRLDEVLVLQGTPMMGVLFSKPILAITEATILATLILGNVCLVAYVYVLNDWAGIEGDLRDPNRAARTFAANGLNRTPVGYLALTLLVLSLAMFGMLGTTQLVLGGAVAITGLLYSAPGIHWKGRPLLNSALHFGGGALHFLLGYSSFTTLDVRGFGISCFFGLVFTAGHFTHEARDYDGDRINGIRTNAVTFGKATTYFIGLACFTAAYAYITLLAMVGLVPFLLVATAALYPLHLYLSLRTFWRGLAFEGFLQLQWCYRFIYACIGVLMVVAVIIS